MDEFILVADDDPALTRLVKAVIEGEGFLVETAKDGKEAYAALKSGVKFVGAVIDNQDALHRRERPGQIYAERRTVLVHPGADDHG